MYRSVLFSVYCYVIHKKFYSYHQKVPEEAPDLELKATYGLAKPEEFTMPSKSAQWIPATYLAFDLAKGMMSDAKVPYVSYLFLKWTMSYLFLKMHNLRVF